MGDRQHLSVPSEDTRTLELVRVVTSCSHICTRVVSLSLLIFPLPDKGEWKGNKKHGYGIQLYANGNKCQ